MIRRESLQIYWVFGLRLNLFIYQIDILSAFLESLFGNNKLSIFMKLLPRLHNLHQIWEGLLYRLLISLHGLKQSETLWNKNAIALYKLINFRQLNGDPSILICYFRGEISVFIVYINNFLLASNTMSTSNVLKQSLAGKYNTKDLGEMKTIIRWQIYWDIPTNIMKVY